MRTGGRDWLVHIGILLYAMSQADPEMKINMQMTDYEIAPGRT